MVYDTKWYEMDIKTRKTFVLMIQRSQKKVGVTAGKFYYLGHESFRQVLSNSFSFYLLLRNIYGN